jgi:hypothetical protein
MTRLASCDCIATWMRSRLPGVGSFTAQTAKDPAGLSGVWAEGILYSIGFVIATGLLHATGIGIGLIHRRPAGKAALRVAGAGIALARLTFLWQALT